MNFEGDLKRGYKLLFGMIRSVSEDCTEDLERIRHEGVTNPMSMEEVRHLLSRCIDEACRGADLRGDHSTLEYLKTNRENVLRQVLRARESDTLKGGSIRSSEREALSLESHERVEPHPVLPPPVFHGRSIPVNEGFVDVGDIRLWGGNQRLKIHVAQFKNTHGREPTSDDLLSIMNSRANLAGLDGNDQFKIAALARSIAAGGVRKAPIISYSGDLLDGNRRVAACLSILASNEFNPQEKARARKIRVWQLTEHAVHNDEEDVVVSLNFEPDYKEDWPEYVKGRILYEEWRATLENEDRPSASRQAKLKRDLARRYAIQVARLNRYIQMVTLAEEFEDYERNVKGRNPHEVQHRTNEYFQYFDELGKGRGAGGVNWAMNQDTTFKELVFDLLFDRKFRNFKAIRDLKYVYQNDEATDLLREALKIDDVKLARERVDDGLSTGRTARASDRKYGGNKRIETFVRWLREVPVGFFSAGRPGAITARNLRRLYEALKLVEVHVPKEDHRGRGTKSAEELADAQ